LPTYLFTAILLMTVQADNALSVIGRVAQVRTITFVYAWMDAPQFARCTALILKPVTENYQNATEINSADSLFFPIREWTDRLQHDTIDRRVTWEATGRRLMRCLALWALR
jgi:hypothetical protein